MSKNQTLSCEDRMEFDRVYREGGLKRMATSHVHYDEPSCPHSGCDHKMEWINFKLELLGDKATIHDPLICAWWEGAGFAGRCPRYEKWIHFTNLEMKLLTDEQADTHLQLPENWHLVAQFA